MPRDRDLTVSKRQNFGASVAAKQRQNSIRRIRKKSSTRHGGKLINEKA